MNIFILLITLVISLVTDIKNKKILNIITLPAIVFGLIYHLFTGGATGLLYSGKGFLVGLGLLLIPYLLGGMGAGDVKLMTAIGALMGPSFVFYSFIYTAIIGGIIALILIVKVNGFQNTLKALFFKLVFFRSNLGSISLPTIIKSGITFPYGVAIVLGTLITLVRG